MPGRAPILVGREVLGPSLGHRPPHKERAHHEHPWFGPRASEAFGSADAEDADTLRPRAASMMAPAYSRCLVAGSFHGGFAFVLCSPLSFALLQTCAHDDASQIFFALVASVVVVVFVAVLFVVVLQMGLFWALRLTVAY